MDLMKPYMPATAENYQRVLRDIHARAIQMWAGCIWVPIYKVMTRKHLTVVTLEENLGMAADIGLDATTSIDEALAQAFARHGDGREGRRAPVRPVPAAAQRRADGARGRARLHPGGRRKDVRRRAPDDPGPARVRCRRERRAHPARDPRLDDDPRAPPALPGRARRAADERDPVPVRALRRGGPRAADPRGKAPSARSPRGARGVPRARGGGGPDAEQIAHATRRAS